MLEFEVKYDNSDAKVIEQLIAESLSVNPAAALKATQKTVAAMLRYKTAALRVTAAHARKRILDIFATNAYNWAEHQTYSNWFGKFGAVSMTGLIAANKPKKAFTKKGNKRKRGYSKTGYIKPPKDIPLGGRLVKSTRYTVSDEQLVVGVLRTAENKVKRKMEQFQDGGVFALHDPERSRRYLAAIGLFLKRSTVIQSKPRPLYEVLAKEGNIAQDYKNTFIEMLLDKKRAGKF